jgi:hypothetical protein
MSTAMVETCRRSCGGHGYLISSGVAENMVASLALVTIEGENTVLYLQTARFGNHKTVCLKVVTFI